MEMLTSDVFCQLLKRKGVSSRHDTTGEGRVGESKTTYRRPGFGFDRVDRNRTALFPCHTQPTYLYRRHPIPAGKDLHRKDRGKVDGQRSRGRANESANGGGKRVQTRKT